MIWITVPLLLALQYFGTKDDILPFERNIKSFVVTVIIITLALPCLTYGLEFLGYFMGKLSIVKTRIVRPVVQVGTSCNNT
jgi:hypothetical protein